MSYQVFYGDSVAIAGCDLQADETSVCSEQFSTEHEALHRARELLDGEPAPSLRSVMPPATC